MDNDFKALSKDSSYMKNMIFITHVCVYVCKRVCVYIHIYMLPFISF